MARHKLETVFSDGAFEARSAVLDEDGALASGLPRLEGAFHVHHRSGRCEGLRRCAVSLDRFDLRGWNRHPRGGRARARGGALAVGRAYRRRGALRAVEFLARPRCAQAATSVYLVDRVIPMLPDELSGDLCSLKPDEVRRTMTADLYLDDRARLVAYDLYPALIRSHARLSYEEAQALLERCHPERSAEGAESKDLVRRDGACAPGDGLSDRLAALSRLAKQRFASRERAGGLDFDSVEARVVLDEEESDGYRLARQDRRDLAHRRGHDPCERDRRQAPARCEVPQPVPRPRAAFGRQLGGARARVPGLRVVPRHRSSRLHRGRCARRPARAGGERGASRGRARVDAPAAVDEAGGVPSRLRCALRPGQRGLHAFHVSHQALSRPCGASYAQGLIGGTPERFTTRKNRRCHGSPSTPPTWSA